MANHNSVQPAFKITTDLPPAPRWFHIAFRNGWGAYIEWGSPPVRGEGLKSAEVEVTYRWKQTGERHGWMPPEKILVLLEAISRRSAPNNAA